jgi:hypothetical protein
MVSYVNALTPATVLRQCCPSEPYTGVQGVNTSTVVAATCVRNLYIREFMLESSLLEKHHCISVYGQAERPQHGCSSTAHLIKHKYNVHKRAVWTRHARAINMYRSLYTT